MGVRRMHGGRRHGRGSPGDYAHLLGRSYTLDLSCRRLAAFDPRFQPENSGRGEGLHMPWRVC